MNVGYASRFALHKQACAGGRCLLQARVQRTAWQAAGVVPSKGSAAAAYMQTMAAGSYQHHDLLLPRPLLHQRHTVALQLTSLWQSISQGLF